MAVFRVERTGNYTVMSNHHLRDKRLSLKAKGLLSLMLSLPEDWDYTLSGLAKINSEGKGAIRSAIMELEQAGYVQRRQTMDRNGQFGTNEYIIREEPFSASPLSKNPTTDFPTTENPSTENCTQIKKDPVKTKKQKKYPQSTEILPSSHPGSEKRSKRKEGRKRGCMSKGEFDACRERLRENLGYEELLQDEPLDAPQLDELVELMTETICSKRETIRISGEDFPQAVVKSRFLKLDGEHIRYILDCLRENTAQVRNMKPYLLTLLFNAPVTIANYYAARVNHDFEEKFHSGAPSELPS